MRKRDIEAVTFLVIIALIIYLVTEYWTYLLIIAGIILFGLLIREVAQQDQGGKTRLSGPPPPKNIKELLYKQQKRLCNGCKIRFLLRNLEIDHVVPKSKGGYHTASNLQLLCGYCNRVKGNRSQKYLLDKVRNQKP